MVNVGNGVHIDNSNEHGTQHHTVTGYLHVFATRDVNQHGITVYDARSTALNWSKVVLELICIQYVHACYLYGHLATNAQ